MGGKSSPAPPDYTGAAREQAAASREITEQQTWANRPTQNTPFGSTQWEVTPQWDPSTSQWLNTWTQNTTLDPMLQWALDNQMYLQGARSELGGDLMGRAEEEFGTPMDWSKMPQGGQSVQAPQGPGDLDIRGGISTRGMQGWGGQLEQEDIQRDLGQTPEEIRNRAEEAIYQRSTSMLDPQWQQRESDLEAKLFSRGLRPGDAAFDREMENLARDRERAYSGAQQEAIMGGGAEAERQFGMIEGAGRFANTASQQAWEQKLGQREADMGLRQAQFMEAAQNRGMSNEEAQTEWEAQRAAEDQRFDQEMRKQQWDQNLREKAIAEEMQRRGFSLNEINALISGQQVGMPDMPGFSQASRSETPDIVGATDMGYQANLGQSNASNAMFGNVLGFGAQMLPFAFSDRRLKHNVQRIGETAGGTPLYAFDYVWGESAVGVMADEVDPSIVAVHPSGFLMVDYSRVK